MKRDEKVRIEDELCDNIMKELLIQGANAKAKEMLSQCPDPAMREELSQLNDEEMAEVVDIVEKLILAYEILRTEWIPEQIKILEEQLKEDVKIDEQENIPDKILEEQLKEDIKINEQENVPETATDSKSEHIPTLKELAGSKDRVSTRKIANSEFIDKCREYLTQLEN